MKKLLFLMLAIGFYASASAQDEPKAKQESLSHAANVTEGVQSMNLGLQNAFTAVLPDTDEKTVNKMWKELMKDYDGKTKSVKKADESLTENVRISAISGSGSISVYSLVKKDDEDVVLTVWFDMGNGAFLNSRDYASTSREAEALLKKFSVDVKREMVKRELEDQEKELKKFETQLERLAKQKESLERDIENYKNKIKEAENNIEKNISEQKDAQKMIEDQKNAVQEVNRRLGEIQ